MHRPVFDVCVVDPLQHTLQGAAILHQIGGKSVRPLIHATPSVINDEVVSSLTLRDETCRGEPKVGILPYIVVRKDHPETLSHEIANLYCKKEAFALHYE